MFFLNSIEKFWYCSLPNCSKTRERFRLARAVLIPTVKINKDKGVNLFGKEVTLFGRGVSELIWERGELIGGRPICSHIPGSFRVCPTDVLENGRREAHRCVPPPGADTNNGKSLAMRSKCEEHGLRRTQSAQT
jgi:hypothetical protein